MNVSECSAETDLENDVSENLERANTWFSRVGVRLSTGQNLGGMLKGMLRHKATPGDVVARMLAGLQTAETPGQISETAAVSGRPTKPVAVSGRPAAAWPDIGNLRRRCRRH